MRLALATAFIFTASSFASGAVWHPHKHHVPAAFARSPTVAKRQHHEGLDRRQPAPDVCISTNNADIGNLLASTAPFGPCFCLSTLPASVQTQFGSLTNVVSIQNSLTSILTSQGTLCTYPANSVQACSSTEPCGFTCNAPYIREGNQCVCPSPSVMCNGQCSTTCTSSIPRSLKNGRELNSNYITTREQAEATCEPMETVCGVFNSASLSSRDLSGNGKAYTFGHAARGGGTKRDFECLNLMNSLESCGGCMVDNPFVLIDENARRGVDCSSISGVENVECVAGRCHVQKCRDDYTISPAGDACDKKSTRAVSSDDMSSPETVTGLKRRMRKALGLAPETATKRSKVLKMGGTPMMKGGKREMTASSDSNVGAGKDGAGATNNNVVKTSGDGNGSSGNGDNSSGVSPNNFKDVVTPIIPGNQGQDGSNIGAAGILDPATNNIEKGTDQTSSGSSTTAANSANGVISSAQDSSNRLSDPSPVVKPADAILGSTDDSSDDNSSKNSPSGTVVNSANAVLGSSSGSDDDSSNNGNGPSVSTVPNSANAFLGSPNRASRVSPQASVVDSTKAIMGSSNDSNDSDDNSSSTIGNSASAGLGPSDDSSSDNTGSLGNGIDPTSISPASFKPAKQVLGSAPSTNSLPNVLGGPSDNDKSNSVGLNSLGLPVSSNDLADGPLQDNGSDAFDKSKDTEEDALDAGDGILSEANGQDAIDSTSSTLLGSEYSSSLVPGSVNTKQLLNPLDAITETVSGCPLSPALQSSMSTNLGSIVADTASIVQSTNVADLNTGINAIFPNSAALYADILSAHDETRASSDDSNPVNVVENAALPMNTDALGLGGLLEAVKVVVKAALNLQSATSGLTDALLPSSGDDSNSNPDPNSNNNNGNGNGNNGDNPNPSNNSPDPSSNNNPSPPPPNNDPNSSNANNPSNANNDANASNPSTSNNDPNNSSPNNDPNANNPNNPNADPNDSNNNGRFANHASHNSGGSAIFVDMDDMMKRLKMPGSMHTTVTGLSPSVNDPSNDMLRGADAGGNPPSDVSSDPGVSTTGNVGSRSTRSEGLSARAVDMDLANNNVKALVDAVVGLTNIFDNFC